MREKDLHYVLYTEIQIF